MASKSAPFPTRDEVLRFVRESPGKVGRREIARAFNIRGNDRAALTELLRSLEEEGAIDGRRTRRRPAGTLPSVTVLEVDGLDPDGALSARPARWDEPEPPPPITLDPAPRGVPEPGEGDRVLARLRPAPDGGYLARPMRVLDAGPRRVVGVFRATSSGGGVIEPAERRSRRDLAVPAEETAGARTGELVVGEIEPGSRLGLPDARVVERLGDADSPGAISLAAIHSHGLPMRFPDAALAEAERATPPGLEGRADLRSLPWSPSTARMPAISTMRSGPRPTPRLTIRAAGARSSPSPTWPISSGPAARSTGQRRSAATPPTFPTAWCRCCPRHSPPTSAR